MKRSGKTNRAEPTDMGWANIFPECEKLFQRSGQFKYFEKIDGFHSEVLYGFAQRLDKDMVSFNTIKIELARELIAKAIYIVDEVKFWFKKIPFTFDSKRFIYLGWKAYTGEKVCNQINLGLSREKPLKYYKVISPMREDSLQSSSIILDFYNI